MAERILNLYVGYAYTDAYWALPESGRCEVRSQIARESGTTADATHLYTVFPARSDIDVFIWSAWDADDPAVTEKAFTSYSATAENWRQYLKATQTLWGFTRPSSYSRGKSEQDMDPLEGPRTSYLVVYPFSKTKEWYLMSMDARQGMMNEHIKIGKQFFDVKQLLVYSFGLQDHEFVVSYEVEVLTRFSTLVNDLRNTEGRRYTLNDTPIITAVHRTPEEFVR
ncbi:MAG TPA: chlorite dismutase family protein [Fimbriimonadaceae bacterium]|nr:chlorite dismutase family protein [Fimbriimonadaceae bacterium]